MTVDSVYQVTKKESQPVVTAVEPPQIIKKTQLSNENVKEEEPLVPVWLIMIVIVSGILHLFARKRLKSMRLTQ